MDRRIKVLLTGGCGFVGGNIVEQAQTRPDLELFALDNRIIPSTFSNVTWHALDLRDQGQLSELFARLAPDVVIHTAAMSDIDFCEKNRKLAQEVNIGVTEALVELAGRRGSRFIWYSFIELVHAEGCNFRVHFSASIFLFMANIVSQLALNVNSFWLVLYNNQKNILEAIG